MLGFTFTQYTKRLSMAKSVPYNLLRFILALFLTANASSALAEKPTVSLTVIPAFKEYVTPSTSYLKRELREISDITLVNKQADFHISVVVAPLHLEEDNEPRGVVVSYHFSNNYDGVIIHNVRISSVNNLKILCQQVITDFDVYYFEDYR
jgi:hypothetical protein